MASFMNREETLNLIGGLKQSYKEGNISIYVLNNNERVVLKESKYYIDRNYYWYGITPNLIDDLNNLKINFMVFVLGFDAILKIPNQWIVEHISTLGPSFKPDGSIKHYHVMIRVDDLKATILRTDGNYDVSDFLVISNDLTETEIENIEIKVSEQSKNDVLRYAKEYKDSGVHHVSKTVTKRERIESHTQKSRIKKLEDYTCQICSFKESYFNVKRKELFIIEADHILEKTNGGGETIDNIIILCPNCHEKKTRGIITIDIKKGQIYERGKPLVVRNNHLTWLKK